MSDFFFTVPWYKAKSCFPFKRYFYTSKISAKFYQPQPYSSGEDETKFSEMVLRWNSF